MQGILHDTAIAQPRQVKEGRFRNVPRKSMSRAEREKSSQNMTRSTSNDSTLKKRVVKQEESTITRKVEKFINRSMQTERSDDIGKLYETGVIKFARPKAKVGPKRGQGDESLSQGMESLGNTHSLIIHFIQIVMEYFRTIRNKNGTRLCQGKHEKHQT